MIYLFAIPGILVVDPLIDWFRITHENHWIKHAPETLVVGLLFAADLVLAWHFGGVPLDVIVIIAANLPAVRWIVHDLLLNWFRGLRWDYLATTRPALADRFLVGIQEVFDDIEPQIGFRIHFFNFKIAVLLFTISLSINIAYLL